MVDLDRIKQAATLYAGDMCSPGEALSDMVADIMHYCDELGLDPDDTVGRGTRHYADELKEAEG